MTNSDRKGLSGLNDEQWATLLGLLNTHKNGTNERLTGKQRLLSSIIDLGASHHMTGTFSYLTELHDIIPCPVGLPNGEKAMALKEGIVNLGEELKLQHVLFVPNLKCNLISVFQLLNDLNLVVQITDKICAI